LPRPDRLIGYSLFIRALSFGGTLWLVVVVQCALVAWLLFRVLETLVGRASGSRYAVLVLVLTFGTALPWVSGQLMADIFTPVLVLSLFLLLEEPQLGRFERPALLGLVALSVTVHLSHLPIGLALLGAALALSRALEEPHPWLRLRAPAAALLAGLVGIAGFNFARTGRLSLASGSDAFVLGHLIDSGIAGRVLDEHCPERDYWLCPHRGQLPMAGDTFLWVDGMGVRPWEQTAAVSKESHRLLVDSLREHPAMHLRVAFEYSVLALAAFRTGEGLDDEAVPLVEAQIARFVPNDVARYRAARQQANALPVSSLRAVHTPIGWLLLALTLGVLGASVRRWRTAFRDPAIRFVAFAATAVLLNALLAGNLSGLSNRYGARVFWLLAVGLWGYASRPRSRVVG
jgi:hypothetical protein